MGVCDYRALRNPAVLQKGQLWRVSGRLEMRPVVVNGDCLMEPHIVADSVAMLRPTGTNIVTWMAESPKCAGVGYVKARRLFDAFGAGLVALIEAWDVSALAGVVTEECALTICRAFEDDAVGMTLAWLDALAIPARIAQKVASFYGKDAQSRVEANPYILCSFAPSWRSVDDLATTRFEVAPDDSRRLEAAVDEALLSGLKLGHTCMPTKELVRRASALLGSAKLARTAMAITSSRWTKAGDIYQSSGLHIVERYLSTRLVALGRGEAEAGQQAMQFGEAPTDEALDEHLHAYERSERVQLTSEQKQAVVTSVHNPLSLILGGAGTGKTTVLKALYAVLDGAFDGLKLFQLALAGRAAQRMAEATGRPSMTIAAFLNSIESAALDESTVIVVDEMSMVDALLMYRLLRAIPLGVRLVLVGDPAQLPPIGPGLVLHALVGRTDVPQVELKVVKRQSAASGIPRVALAVRRHEPPLFADYGGAGVGVSAVPCAQLHATRRVAELYRELGGTGADYSVQVLSTTKSGPGGVHEVNAALHAVFSAGAQPVTYRHPEFGVTAYRTDGGGAHGCTLKVGDLVMYTKNDYRLGLRNGSLGRILESLPPAPNGEETACCVCDFEGMIVELSHEQLEHVSHAYSITVHKSQGSQFNRIIVPIFDGALLDQALIYTAITRGVAQVVLLGDIEAILRAVSRPPAVHARHVALPTLLAEAALQPHPLERIAQVA